LFIQATNILTANFDQQKQKVENNYIGIVINYPNLNIVRNNKAIFLPMLAYCMSFKKMV